MEEKEADTKGMTTEEMIEWARGKRYGEAYAMLSEEVNKSGKNYFETPRWIEHEKKVLKAIGLTKTRRERTALEGLIL